MYNLQFVGLGPNSVDRQKVYSPKELQLYNSFPDEILGLVPIKQLKMTKRLIALGNLQSQTCNFNILSKRSPLTYQRQNTGPKFSYKISPTMKLLNSTVKICMSNQLPILNFPPYFQQQTTKLLTLTYSILKFKR